MTSHRSLQSGALLALGVFTCAAQAAVGAREAAASLERQMQADHSRRASQGFTLPLQGSEVALTGEATLEAIDAAHCRLTMEIVHDRPFERRGLRITNLSRRSVQEGACQGFANAFVAQANSSAKSISEQIGLGAAEIDATPGERVLVAGNGSIPGVLAETRAVAAPTAQAPAAVSLTVLEKAIIRDAPSRQGEKLSRADAGTRLKAWRVPGNPEWFALDGGLRFISASVVDVSDAATVDAPARGDNSRIHLKVMERAVVRNKPSFNGKKVATLKAGVERLARKVPGMAGWFELTDSESSYPLYIHESVVTAKPAKAADKRV